MSQSIRYASVIAKIGAERSKLLSETKLKALSESKSVSEISAHLRDTSYQEYLSELSSPITGRKLERIFHENLIDTYLKIIEYSPEQAVRYLELYLLRIQSENLKSLIRAAHARLPTEQRTSRIYLSVEKYFKQAELVEEATKASAIAQIVHVYKRTDYNEALSLGLKSYEESGSQTSIEIFIDKLFYEKLCRSYERLPQREKSHARFYASLENDSFVLLTLLRGKILNYDPNWLRLAVPPNSFNLNKREVEAIVSALNFEAAYKLVLDSYYGKYFERASTPEETVANAERAFRRDLLRHAKASAIEEIFNIGSTLGFITLKEAEVHNLTALALGVEASMTPEAIRSQLFL